jgi:hypothetical protein
MTNVWKIVNNTVAALAVVGVLTSSIWVVADAINAAHSANAVAADARRIAEEVAKKIESLDVIQNNIDTINKEIDVLQMQELTTREKTLQKLDEILEQVEK